MYINQNDQQFFIFGLVNFFVFKTLMYQATLPALNQKQVPLQNYLPQNKTILTMFMNMGFVILSQTYFMNQGKEINLRIYFDPLQPDKYDYDQTNNIKTDLI